MSNIVHLANRRAILETAVKEALQNIRPPLPPVKPDPHELSLPAKIAAFESLRRWAAWGRP